MFGKAKKLASRLDDALARIETLKADRERLKARVESLRSQIPAGPAGAGLASEAPSYLADGVAVWGKNTAFLEEERFRRAYRRGVESGHRFTRSPGDLHVEWRVHVVLWAAGAGLRLEGDFVECGVNTGIFSLAILDYYGEAVANRPFHLFDTFAGSSADQLEEREREGRAADNQLYYPDCYEVAKANFAPYPNCQLVRGRVPDTLEDAGVGKVAYLSIDMNVAAAELAAIEFFWDRLVPGAVVVLDDYAWSGCEAQKEALDGFAGGVGTSILSLPTGQGLIVKI